MKKSLLFLSLAAFLSLGILDAKAQCQNQGKDKSECCQMSKFPGLSDEQKNKIKAIKIQEDKQLLPIENQIKEKKAHLNTLRTAAQPNMSEINSTVEEIGKLKTDIEKIREANIQEIRKVLNDEQRLMFDKQEHHGKGGHGFHGGHHHGDAHQRDGNKGHCGDKSQKK